MQTSKNQFVLTIRDDLAQDFKFNYTMNDESTSSILISALVDQLEGSYLRILKNIIMLKLFLRSSKDG